MTTEITTLQKAWYTITQLKQRLKNQEITLSPIAIVGIGCRFPGAPDKNAFWQLLCTGKNIISSLPEERWELLKDTDEFFQRDTGHTYWGGFLPNITEFDAYFFGISPREAVHMDPQQRLMLEVAFETFEDAGMSQEMLLNSNTGVFASLYASEFGYLQKLDNDLDALFIPTGNATAMGANRLSYLFNLRGPSMVIDTACSSSLVAVYLACLNLQNRKCDQALVCGANINLFPSTNLLLSKAKMLSPDGQCKTFDAGANGYVQGEGIGAIMLKTLDQAKKDKDRIYAVILGADVNQDGKTNGLTAPNGLQQERLLRTVYSSTNIDPRKISYIECHGTGTFLGDPIEVQSLGEVIGHNRDIDNPCWLGSVKTNIGHLEPAAGIASMIKMALSLQHMHIPQHLNVTKPNPLIEFEKYQFRIPQQSQEWPKYGEYRMGGVSGFGFGGTNSHVLLREITEDEKVERITDAETRVEIFTCSAKDSAALTCYVERWCRYLENNLSVSLSQICYNTHIRRSHFFHRLAIVTDTTEKLYQALCQIRDKQPFTLTKSIFISEEKIAKQNDFDDSVSLSSMDLHTIASYYVNHVNIDWLKYEGNRQLSYIDIPSYPWQHKFYWPKLNSKEKKKDQGVVSRYPFQGRLITSPLKIIQVEFQFDANVIPEIKDTYHILHAGYYLEMLAFAVNEVFHQQNFTIEDLTFSAPIVVPEDKSVQVQLLFDISDNKDMFFTIYSNAVDKNNWKEHTRGKLLLEVKQHKKNDSILQVKQRSVKHEKADVFYSKVRAMDMPVDGSIRWVNQYWLGENEVLCELQSPRSIPKENHLKLKLHFGAIDACIQGLFMLLPKNTNYPYVAANISKLRYFGMRGDHLYLLARFNEMQPNGESFSADWYLVNSEDEVIIECENIVMKKISQTVKLDRIRQAKEQIDYDWAPLTLEKRKQKVIQYLRSQIEVIFSMPQDDIDILRSLHDMGMDSLMALVLMKSIETGFGITYSMQAILQGPSIAEMADFIIQEKVEKTDFLSDSSIKMTSFDMPTVNPWIAYRQTSSAPKLRLFCFPYGGGGASIYRNWSSYLPDTIEVCPIQFPGREDRIREPAIHNLNHLIEAIFENIKEEMNMPFAFFGHSFGSLVLFELSRRLRQVHHLLPTHLFVSAYPSPTAPTKSLDNLLNELKRVDIHLFELSKESLWSQLTNEQLSDLVTIFNKEGVTDYDASMMNIDAIKILLPIFIADMEIVKSYKYNLEPPLDIPMTVFFGTKDTWVLPCDLEGWSNQVSQPCDFYKIDSGHLFIKNEQYLKAVLQKIKMTLTEKWQKQI